MRTTRSTRCSNSPSNRPAAVMAAASSANRDLSMTSPKIAFIGAGSTVFAKNLIGDILSHPDLADARITLFDIDPERLATSETVAYRIAEALGAPATIEATTDRSRALDGAD